MVAVNLAPAVLDLAGIRAGDRNLLRFVLTQSGAPVSLAGQEVQAQARKVSTDAGPAALTAVVVVLDEAGGVFTVQWPGDDVRTLLADEASWIGVWDLQFGPVGEEPTTVAAGSFKAEQDVTR